MVKMAPHVLSLPLLQLHAGTVLSKQVLQRIGAKRDKLKVPIKFENIKGVKFVC